MALYRTPFNLVSLPGAVGGELLDFDASGVGRVIPAGAANQVLVADGVGGNSFLDFSASLISYDNAGSGLTGTNVQDAIDELDNIIDNLSITDLADVPNDFTGSAYRVLRVNDTETGMEFATTSATLLDSGTTAERPVTPLEGMIRYNTDINGFEYYDGFTWQAVGTGGGGGGGLVVEAIYEEDDLGANDYDWEVLNTVLTLPAPHQGNIANLWVSFDGIDQFTGFSLQSTDEILFPLGIPTNTDEVRIKVATSPIGSSLFDIDLLPANTPLSTDLLAFSGASVGGTESQVSIADLATVLDPLISGTPFDIDTLPAAVPLATDIIAFSGGSVAGTESQATINDLVTVISPLVAFDIDALPVGATLNNTDYIAFSDQSDGQTDKKVTLSTLASFIGGGGGLDIDSLPAGLPQDNDLIVFSDQNNIPIGTEKQATVAQLIQGSGYSTFKGLDDTAGTIWQPDTEYHMIRVNRTSNGVIEADPGAVNTFESTLENGVKLPSGSRVTSLSGGPLDGMMHFDSTLAQPEMHGNWLFTGGRSWETWGPQSNYDWAQIVATPDVTPGFAHLPLAGGLNVRYNDSIVYADINNNNARTYCTIDEAVRSVIDTEILPQSIQSTRGMFVKAFGLVGFAGGAPVLGSNFNISSVVDNGVGQTTVNTSVSGMDLGAQADAINITPQYSILYPVTAAFTSIGVQSFDVITQDAQTGTLVDNNFYVTVCADY